MYIFIIINIIRIIKTIKIIYILNIFNINNIVNIINRNIYINNNIEFTYGYRFGDNVKFTY